MNRWLKVVIIGNIYSIVFLLLGWIFKFNLASSANGLFYSMGIFIMVGLIALLNPRRAMMKHGEEIKHVPLKERLTRNNDNISKGYRIFLYCFLICTIIMIYSYFAYEIGAKALGIE